MKPHLSIFSFETLRALKLKFPAGLVMAVGTLLVVELGLHLAVDVLPAPVLWDGFETAAKIAQATAFPESNIDLLILGPSHGSVGVSPAVMMASLGTDEKTIYNGALVGRDYTVVEFVYKEVYQPSLEPQALVLCASPIVLNANNLRMQCNTERFFQSPMPRAIRQTGLGRVWQFFLNEHVYLYRYRKREAGLAQGCVLGKRRLDDYGFWACPGTYDPTQCRMHRSDYHYRQVILDFEFAGPSVEAFRRILDGAKRTNTPTVVLNMPFRPSLLTFSPDAPETYQSYLVHMRELCERYDFLWLDYQQTLDLSDGDFSDVDHLNPNGAAKLSRSLTHDLVEHRVIGRQRVTTRPTTEILPAKKSP